MNIDFEIEELKKEYKKALKELHELLVLFNPHCSEDVTFESAMERLTGNQLTEDEENLLFDILKANNSIKDLDIRIKKLEAKRDYNNQVRACYRAYITQQEKRRMMDDGDEHVKCYERYIPDEVETGYNPIEEKTRGIKKVQLETMPVVEDINLEEEEYVSNSELGGFVNKVNNKLEKDRARRRKGEKAAGNFRPSC